MSISRSSIMTAVFAASMLFATATAHADPAAADESIHFHTDRVGDTVVSSVDAGAFRVARGGNSVDLTNSRGDVITSIPLEFTYNGLPFPIAAAVSQDSRQVTLTPHRLSPVEVTQVSKAAERQSDWNIMVDEVMKGWNNGGLMSAGIGATIGQIAGCVLIFYNPIVGCVLGTVVGGGIGALVGVIRGNDKIPPAVYAYMTTFVPEGAPNPIPNIPGVTSQRTP